MIHRFLVFNDRPLYSTYLFYPKISTCKLGVEMSNLLKEGDAEISNLPIKFRCQQDAPFAGNPYTFNIVDSLNTFN